MFVARILDVARCCKVVDSSYCHKASTVEFPVRSWTSFSGTLASNKAVAAVARRQWFVLFRRPASSHMFFTMEASLFFPIGTDVYHGPFWAA